MRDPISKCWCSTLCLSGSPRQVCYRGWPAFSLPSNNGLSVIKPEATYALSEPALSSAYITNIPFTFEARNLDETLVDILDFGHLTTCDTLLVLMRFDQLFNHWCFLSRRAWDQICTIGLLVFSVFNTPRKLLHNQLGSSEGIMIRSMILQYHKVLSVLCFLLQPTNIHRPLFSSHSAHRYGGIFTGQSCWGYLHLNSLFR